MNLVMSHTVNAKSNYDAERGGLEGRNENRRQAGGSERSENM